MGAFYLSTSAPDDAPPVEFGLQSGVFSAAAYYQRSSRQPSF